MKRKSFSLIELVITLPLIALLLTFLLKNLTSTLILNKDAEIQHLSALKEHYFQRRFQQILNRVESKKQKREYFEEAFLEFNFNNGISKSPQTRGNVFSSLYLDPEDQILKLALYSDSRKQKRLRTEKLLENVSSVKFNYIFEEKNQDHAKKNPFSINLDKKTAKPSHWVGLEVIVSFDKDQARQYFFYLPRSRAPS